MRALQPLVRRVPTLTVMIGSIARPTLEASLVSIARQPLRHGDQVVVSFDGHEKNPFTFDVRSMLERFAAAPWLQICAHDAGYHWLGVEQINFAMQSVPMTGTHVTTIGDDDVFVPGAYDVIRPVLAANPGRVVLWQFLAPDRKVMWDRKGVLEMNHISGCCAAVPVEICGLHPTARYIQHDYDWIVDAVTRSGHDPVFLERVLVVTRPETGGCEEYLRRA